MNITQTLLIHLMEEFGECIQSTSKCLRFGIDHKHYEESNVERLRNEFEQVVAIILILRHAGLPLEIREEQVKSQIGHILDNLELSQKMQKEQS